MRSYAQRMRKPQLENLRQSTAAGHMSNQAVLGVLNEPDGDTRFSEALRAKFEAKAMPQSEHARPMALTPDVLQKAEERYQTPLAGLKAYEDTGLLDSGYNGYAQGNEIHIDSSLAPAEREEVLMHEIGHVVQRGSGKAQGSGLLDNPTLEQQADQGFTAPQNFTMPASSAGPVMGMKGKGRYTQPPTGKGVRKESTDQASDSGQPRTRAKDMPQDLGIKEAIRQAQEEGNWELLRRLKETRQCAQMDLNQRETELDKYKHLSIQTRERLQPLMISPTEKTTQLKQVKGSSGKKKGEFSGSAAVHAHTGIKSEHIKIGTKRFDLREGDLEGHIKALESLFQLPFQTEEVNGMIQFLRVRIHEILKQQELLDGK